MNKICLALDTDQLTAYKLVKRLKDKVGLFKIGLRLFIEAGPRFVRELSDECNGKIFF